MQYYDASSYGRAGDYYCEKMDVSENPWWMSLAHAIPWSSWTVIGCFHGYQNRVFNSLLGFSQAITLSQSYWAKLRIHSTKDIQWSSMNVKGVGSRYPPL